MFLLSLNIVNIRHCHYGLISVSLWHGPLPEFRQKHRWEGETVLTMNSDLSLCLYQTGPLPIHREAQVKNPGSFFPLSTLTTSQSLGPVEATSEYITNWPLPLFLLTHCQDPHEAPSPLAEGQLPPKRSPCFQTFPPPILFHAAARRILSISKSHHIWKPPVDFQWFQWF